MEKGDQCRRENGSDEASPEKKSLEDGVKEQNSTNPMEVSFPEEDGGKDQDSPNPMQEDGGKEHDSTNPTEVSFSEEDGVKEHDSTNTMEVSPKGARTEQIPNGDNNEMASSLMSSKTPGTIPSQLTETQEPEPEENGLDLNQEGTCVESASSPAPTEASQEPESEEKNNGIDLNHEGIRFESASIPARNKLPVAAAAFDLNEQIVGSSSLPESPTKSSRSGMPIIDLNHIDSHQCFPSPSSSSVACKMRNSPVAQPSLKNIERKDTEKLSLYNDYLPQGVGTNASVFRIWGTNVEVKSNKDIPQTMSLPYQCKPLRLFGQAITPSPPVIDLSDSGSSSNNDEEREEPEWDQELHMAGEKKTSSSSSTSGGKRKEPESGLEPENGLEPYSAETKKANLC